MLLFLLWQKVTEGVTVSERNLAKHACGTRSKKGANKYRTSYESRRQKQVAILVQLLFLFHSKKNQQIDYEQILEINQEGLKIEANSIPTAITT